MKQQPKRAGMHNSEPQGLVSPFPFIGWRKKKRSDKRQECNELKSSLQMERRD